MGSEGRTRLALAGLLGTTIAAYMQVMGPGEYAGAVLLGMAIAGALAVAGRRLGLGTPVSALLSALALLTYLGLVFAGDDTAYGLPTPAAVASIARAVGRAYGFVELDYAPVLVRPGYVVMLVAGFWGATALGEVATFRWRRPLLASVAPIGLFSIAVVVGTGTFVPVLVVLFLAALLTFWGLESVHRLRSWGRWVSTWPGRSDDEPASVVGVVGRRMAASTIALALASPFVLPALGEGALAWRSGLGDGTGSGPGGDGTSIDPLVSIASTLTGRSEQELFRVETAADSVPRWHLWTLSSFDGTEWEPALDPTHNPMGGDVGALQPAGAPFERLEYRVEISNLIGERMPVAYHPSSIETNEGADQGDVLVNPETGDVALARALEDDLAYDVISEVPAPTEEALRAAGVGFDGGDPVYRALPPGAVSEPVRKLLQRWTRRAEKPIDELVAIQQRLREFTYSADPGLVDTTAEGVTADYLREFLLEDRLGFCQQFATAFAVLSRQLGYPTRVVVGFMPGLRIAGEAGGRAVYVVRGSDAHAWPEVFFRGIGWVPFEPTPRPDQLDAVPEYTQPDVAAGAGPGGGAPPSLRNRASQLAERAGAAGDDAPIGDGRGARDREAEWERRFARLLTIVALGALAFLAAVPALKRWTIRRRYARARDAREAIAAAFADFEQAAADLATPRARSETATAYAARVARAAYLSESAGRRLAALYDAALYAPAALRDERAREARALAKQLKDGLWAHASWWSRGARLFSTRGLALPGRS